MQCIRCNNPVSSIINTIKTKYLIHRVRKCTKCNNTFKTQENIRALAKPEKTFTLPKLQYGL
jgi:transcriptional regulator NrdR family protein